MPRVCLVVIPDARKNRVAPLSSFRTPGTTECSPLVVIPDARSAIRNRLQSPGSARNRFQVPLTLRVSGPGMTSWVDARRDKPSAPPIVIPDARSAIRDRLPQSAPHAPEQLAPSTALIRRAATTYCRFRVVSPANAVGVRPTAGFGMTIDCWPRLGANQE